MNLVLHTMSIRSLSSELTTLWASSYTVDTVNTACILADQIHVLKDNTLHADLLFAEKGLAKHDACLALHTLVLGDWWRSENFERLHFLMDDVADACNTDNKQPIPLWSHVYDMILKYKGGDANMHWRL